MNQESDVAAALNPLLKALDHLHISYYVSGSVASSIYGAFRATRDVDMVFSLDPEHVDELVSSLKSQYYIDKSMIIDAIQRSSSFNLIHLKTMFKIDIFILKKRKFDQQSFQRRRKNKVDEASNLAIYCASPEDIILHKLEWFRMGHHISERQWNDVLGVLKVQHNQLDLSYLKHWAAQLNILDLLEKALIESK